MSLAEYSQLSKKLLDTGLQFKDLFSSMFEMGADEDEDFEEDESSTPLSSSGVGRTEKQSNCIQTDIAD